MPGRRFGARSLSFLLNGTIRNAVNRALNAGFYCVNLSAVAGIVPHPGVTVAFG
jgi:hypothetical protein